MPHIHHTTTENVFRNMSNRQVVKKQNFAFIGIFPRNWEIIFQKFWENSWGIWNNFVKVTGNFFWNFKKISDFSVGTSEKLQDKF